MSDEAALLKAIIANAGDDTPRLVYADWLDEHEAPIQAEFIRTQCRLASASAADPDYPDLLERSEEVATRFALALKLTAPQLPPGFQHENDFRRGFLHTACGEWRRRAGYHIPTLPTDEQIETVCAGLPDLVATTTVRHLELLPVPPDALARVLAEPAARALTGLSVSPGEFGAGAGDELIRAIGSRVAPNLERLELFCSATATGLSALNANSDRLRALVLPELSGRAGDVPVLTQTGWFRGLREILFRTVDRSLQEPLLASLANLPRLEVLDLRPAHLTAMKVLGTAAGFPQLARLSVGGWAATHRIAERIARGRFPRLAELAITYLRDDWLAPLLGAKWFPQIRVFDAAVGHLTDKGATALSKSAAAPHLRVLRVGHNRFAKAGLAALGNGDRFPNLTTLAMRVNGSQVRPETLARFAAEFSLPQIRHLDLGGWPLGDAGAKALAANPHLAGVARLSLPACGIGERGLTALVRSPHLQQLVELDIGSNNLKRAAALLDTDLLPRLAKLDLHRNPLKPADRERLHRARGWLV